MNLSQISNLCSLEDLIQKLNIPARKDTSYYNQLIQSVNISSKNISSYCHWDEQSYTRSLVFGTDFYQLLILCWQQGQASPVHDHQGQDCWMHVVDGSIQETLYHLTSHLDQCCILQEADRRIYHSGDTSRLKNPTSVWHSVQALNPNFW